MAYYREQRATWLMSASCGRERDPRWGRQISKSWRTCYMAGSGDTEEKNTISTYSRTHSYALSIHILHTDGFLMQAHQILS